MAPSHVRPKLFPIGRRPRFRSGFDTPAALRLAPQPRDRARYPREPLPQTAPDLPPPDLLPTDAPLCRYFPITPPRSHPEPCRCEPSRLSMHLSPLGSTLQSDLLRAVALARLTLRLLSAEALWKLYCHSARARSPALRNYTHCRQS